MSRFLPGVLAFAVALPAFAADWPQFRGPDRTNVSPDKGLLKEWPAEGPKLLWKGAGVGDGYSSVVVASKHVYTMGNKGGSACLFALDRETGKLAWETPVGAPGSGGRPSFPGTRCTPATDGQIVVGLGPKGDLLCADAETGKELWKKSLMSEYGGSHGVWEYSESPLIDGDRVICVPGGRKATLLVLDKKKGTEIWAAPLGDQAGYASIVISSAGGIKQYVALTQGGTIGVDAATGKELWRYKKLANNTANIPTPIVLGDQIYTVAGYGKGAALLSLSKAENGVTMKEEYYSTDMKNKHGGVVIVGDYVYGDLADRGDIGCVEWKTGNVKWKKGRAGKGSGSASITCADGHLYIRYSNGIMSLVPVSPEGYKEVGSFKIPGSDRNSWAHPVVIDGKMYLREKDTVYCYDVKAS